MLNRTVRRLQEEIRASELRVIDSDLRLADGVRALRHTVSRTLGSKLVAGGGLLAAGWLLGRPRRRARQRPPRGMLGRYAPHALQRAFPLLLPIVTPLLNRKMGSILASVGAPAAAASRPAHPPLRAAPTFDPERFAGLWYEAARLQERPQEVVQDAVSLYSVDRDGMIVVERWSDAHARPHETVGRLRMPDAREPARMEYTRAPTWLRWWPGAWTARTVIYVDSEYACALVGTPQRDALWLLSRDPELPDNARQALLALADRLGFDATRVRATPQSS